MKTTRLKEIYTSVAESNSRSQRDTSLLSSVWQISSVSCNVSYETSLKPSGEPCNSKYLWAKQLPCAEYRRPARFNSIHETAHMLSRQPCNDHHLWAKQLSNSRQRRLTSCNSSHKAALKSSGKTCNEQQRYAKQYLVPHKKTNQL